jgi:predicted phosphodiesterase
MTKYTIVSDIHANYPALKAVVEKENNPLICLGDIVGLSGYPKETVDLLREEVEHAIAGNHDVAVVEYGEGHVNDEELSKYEREYTHSELLEEDKEWVNSLGTYGELRNEGILMAHAKPTLEESAGYKMGNAGVEKKDVIEWASKVPDWVDYLLLGHVHDMFCVDCSKFGHEVTVINPGSLGYNNHYATLDTETDDVGLNMIDYDTEQVEEKIKEVAPKTWF